MKKSTKIAKQKAQLVALMAQMSGKSPEEIEGLAHEENPMSTPSMQLDGILNFIEAPPKFITRQCKECGQFFGTNYRAVGYCSDTCRKKNFENHFGVPWDSSKSQVDRWGGTPPTIISPTLWRNLEDLLRQIQKGRSEGTVQMKESEEPVQYPENLETHLPLIAHDAAEEHNPQSAQTSPQPSPSSEFSFEEPLEDFSFDLD